MKTRIEWTARVTLDGRILPGYTFNPWWGCIKCAAGCAHCYAELQSDRFSPGLWGPDGRRRLFGEAHWDEPLRWNRYAQREGTRLAVFCGSMCDVFDERGELNVEREKLWALIDTTRWLDWLLLTKRPRHAVAWHRVYGWPRNAWAGISIADNRDMGLLEHLFRLPTWGRFVSFEPGLELINFHEVLGTGGVDWLIVGGESGPKARPFDLEWARKALVAGRDCRVPVFVKQLGKMWAAGPGGDGSHKGNHPATWPVDLRVRDLPAFSVPALPGHHGRAVDLCQV